MRGKLVVGNWKMNGSLRQNDALLADLRSGWTATPSRRIAVCVPFPYLGQAQAALSASSIAWGAQNISEHASGAFTGEVAAAMLAEFGCRLRDRRPLGAADAVRRDRRGGREQGEGGAGSRIDADRLRRRDACRARGCGNGSGRAAPVGRRHGGARRGDGAARSSPTSRCGRSAPAGPPRPRRRRPCTRIASQAADDGRRGGGRDARCCTAAASRRTTPRRCLHARISTAA